MKHVFNMLWSKAYFLQPKVRKIMLYCRDIHEYINLSLNLDDKEKFTDFFLIDIKTSRHLHFEAYVYMNISFQNNYCLSSLPNNPYHAILHLQVRSQLPVHL